MNTKRLTERDEYGNANIIGVNSANLQLNLDFDEFNIVTEALNKLADYEDAEDQKRLVFLKNKMPDYDFMRMFKLFLADLEGRIVILPQSYENKEDEEDVENFPVADVRPVVRGKWKRKGQEIYCTACGEDSAYNAFGASKFSAFCPNCGADMRKPTQEEENERTD